MLLKKILIRTQSDAAKIYTLCLFLVQVAFNSKPEYKRVMGPIPITTMRSAGPWQQELVARDRYAASAMHTFASNRL